MIDKDKVIQLAREAELFERGDTDLTLPYDYFRAVSDLIQAAYRLGLEDAAKVCEEQANGLTLVPLEAYRAFFLADSIRSLKESTNG